MSVGVTKVEDELWIEEDNGSPVVMDGDQPLGVDYEEEIDSITKTVMSNLEAKLDGQLEAANVNKEYVRERVEETYREHVPGSTVYMHLGTIVGSDVETEIERELEGDEF